LGILLLVVSCDHSWGSVKGQVPTASLAISLPFNQLVINTPNTINVQEHFIQHSETVSTIIDYCPLSHRARWPSRDALASLEPAQSMLCDICLVQQWARVE
jgi:hypothetical protein